MAEYIITGKQLEWLGVPGIFTEQEIVRCKDCAYYKEREFLPDECVRDGYLMDVEPDGFCKWGERK